MQKEKVVLVILDGFGLAPMGPGNAVALAQTPCVDEMRIKALSTSIEASGEAVGLPPGQMGNSEVGHLNLGAGRVVEQSLSFLNRCGREGQFVTNPTIVAAMEQAKKGGTLHLMGLASDGGVHSEMEHLRLLLQSAQEHKVPKVRLHLFTDGRDTDPHGAKKYLHEIEEWCRTLHDDAKIATVVGRYYAMDRDRRWPRIKKAWDLIFLEQSEYESNSGESAVQASYDRDVTDEFIETTLIEGVDRRVPLQEDAIFWFNFRGDRARQILTAICDTDFEGFERPGFKSFCKHVYTLMPVASELGLPCAFQLPELTRCLAQVLEEEGKVQFHAAETEKYPHVTYFFNAQREEPFEHEERCLVASPKVATYDLQPEMSEKELTQKVVQRLQKESDDFVLVNFANPDMVGHTGVLEAAIAACEAADHGLMQIRKQTTEQGRWLIVVADHGNAEMMLTDEGQPHTAHTTNLVPCLIEGPEQESFLIEEGGKLADIAPTVLQLLGLKQPSEMTGRSMLKALG